MKGKQAGRFPMWGLLSVVALLVALASSAGAVFAGRLTDTTAGLDRNTPVGPNSTFRNRIAQVPTSPTSSQSVRVWIENDTAFGETAGVEYHPVNTGTYIKVLGTFDTGGPSPANWRVDIPAQPAGTEIEYQLFTRNEF